MELTKNCTGCMACYNKCPNNAISIVYNEAGFYTPQIDNNKCTNCGLCASVCPQTKEIQVKDEPTHCYAVMSNDEIRKNSASGGLFALIAQEYLKNGGFVCGASFSDDFRQVNHIIIDKEEDLIKLQNSKYVQSNIGDVFSKIKLLLENNKEVLFGGTPCQVAGLNSYLGKRYDNLLTMDLVCHGIPSPLVWTKYLDELTNGKTIKSVFFRNKKEGWHFEPEVEINLKNRFYKRKIKNKLFYRAFFEHLILNDTCYSCKYANLQRPSDITMADFWGIENIDAEMNDEKGTSLLIINTQRGQEIIDKYKHYFKKIKKFNINEAINGNPRLQNSSEKNLDNTQFVKELNKTPILKNIKQNLCPQYEGVIKNFWECDNFGATLSAYAIQQYFLKRGKNYYLLKTSSPKGFVQSFAEKYLKTTHIVSTPIQYEELNQNTNNFIIGTDQVLRPLLIEYNLMADLFGFTSYGKKRIAFSGSFGMVFLEKMSWINRYQYSKLIKRFDNISTREITGKNICKKEFNINAEYIIDPVFLIDKNKWLEIAPDTKDKYRGKIVCYIFEMHGAKANEVKEFLEKKYNKEVVMLTNTKLPVEEFISAIKDSDGLVTNSFHGTCFALIFNKKVLGITNSTKGDARFDSLIKLFDIEKLTVEKIEDIYEREELFCEYNFQNFLSVVEKERKRAEAYFEQIVNKEKQITFNNFIAEINYKVFLLTEKFLKFIIYKYINIVFLVLHCITRKKIVLWGASLFLADLLKKNSKIANHILCIIDKNPMQHNKKFFGCMIYPPEKLVELNPKLIISTVKNNHRKVYKEIVNFVNKNCPTATILPDIFEG